MTLSPQGMPPKAAGGHRTGRAGEREQTSTLLPPSLPRAPGRDWRGNAADQGGEAPALFTQRLEKMPTHNPASSRDGTRESLARGPSSPTKEPKSFQMPCLYWDKGQEQDH